MPYVNVDNLQLYYEEMGTGVPLLLLHGALGSIDQGGSGWLNSMPAFAEKYRAIHVEHRGHGRSSNPLSYYTYELIAEDLVAFIHTLELGPVHIAGVSDGAIVALHMGMHHAELVKTLVCVGVNFYNDDKVRQANASFSDLGRLEAGNPEWAQNLARYHDRNKEPGYWRVLLEQTAANLAVNPNYSIDSLQRIEAPTLLIAGENDPWGNLNQMTLLKQNVKNSEMLILNNAGHVVQFTHREIVEPIVLDFLNRKDKPSEIS